MAYPTSRGAFAAVIHHFENPHVKEEVLLTVDTEGNDEPIRLSPPEAREALYGPDAAPELATAVWKATLRAACAEATPHGPWQLLAIWLALPRLTGTAYRICGRLRVDRSDVESEMVLALLEELRTVDPESPLSAQTLIRAACGGGWRFARAALREAPSTHLENIAEGDHRALTGGTAESLARQADFELEVTRPEGAAGLNASLRFRVSTAQLEEEVLRSLTDHLGSHKVVSRTKHSGRKRRTGTMSLRRCARRR